MEFNDRQPVTESTYRRGCGILDKLMRDFYAKPENRAAFEEWQKKRTEAEHHG